MSSGLAVDEEAIAWLATMLGNDDDRSDAASVERWAVLPSVRRPRMLVPLGAPRAANAVLARDTGFGTATRRLAALAFRLGITPPGLGGRLRVPAGRSFTRWIADQLDEPELRAGVTIGPPRPNRKPVVQLVRPDGTTVAWAKVSCTPLTSALVINEGAWLERLDRVPPAGSNGRRVEAPRLMMRARWHDLDVLILAPLPERRRAGDFTPDAHLLRTIAALDDGRVHVATKSPWWSMLHRRAEAVSRPEGRTVLAPALLAIADRLGSATWPFGAWHGDLTSWNARACGAITQIWDWERAASRKPIGFDAVHAAFQFAQVRRRLDVPIAAAAADVEIAPLLADLDIDPSTGPDLVTCYLIERWLRWDEDTRLGSGTASGERHDAILLAISSRQPGMATT